MNFKFYLKDQNYQRIFFLDQWFYMLKLQKKKIENFIKLKIRGNKSRDSNNGKVEIIRVYEWGW